MKKLLSCFVFLVALTSARALHAQQAPSIQWQKCFGGTITDSGTFIEQTTDGGFIGAGWSYSTNGQVTGNHGDADYWIIKLDTVGNLVWQKSYGGSGSDNALSIHQTIDGGYVIAGWSDSNDGDVSGYHGGDWAGDFWLIKIDSLGNMEWQKCLGGSGDEFAPSLIQTYGGEFIVAGYSSSNDGDVSGNHGSVDCWVVKLDLTGNILWQKSFGGTEYDVAYSIQQTSDSGFILAGQSSSVDGDVTGNHGMGDYWIVKLNSGGSLLWQKSLGGSKNDVAKSIEQISDGGFIVAGYSGSNDGDITSHHGSIIIDDYWIIKLDSVGNLIWQKSLGGSHDDMASSIEQTSDSGFIVAGSSYSNDWDVTGHHSGNMYPDYWVVKIDAVGNLVWQKSLGGWAYESPGSVQQTSDDGFIIGGTSDFSDGDVSGIHGMHDYWMVKLTSDVTGIAPPSTNFISVSPNPVHSQLTINLATPITQVTIRVYDLQGRIIALPTTFTNTQAKLNTEKLPDGFYTLQIINNKTGESEVGKFVKQ